MCKGRMLKGTTNLPYELDLQRVIVIKDVPALVCDQCGESFVELETTKQVEKIIHNAQRDGMTLGFVSYKTAA